MKNYKKGLVASLVLGSMVLTPINSSQVNADTISNNLTKVGDRGDYQDIVGPHLIVTITGVDKNGNEILYPSFMEFHIKPGQVLNKKKIIEYIEWTLDGTDYKKYRVVDLAPDSKIQVSYFSKTEKQYVTEYFPITDKGFVVPDLSEHTSNPGFSLVTNVTIEERNPK